MSLLVTGSIGIDTIQTPTGQASDVLGGSAVYFSLAASLLSPVRLVGVVGEDFPRHFLDVFAGRPIDIRGLETRKGSKTFRWHGRYAGDMNEAETLRTDLNVLGEGAPTVPAAFRDSKVVFLANTHPALQRELLAQVDPPEFVVCDTMNLWIRTTREELCKMLATVDGVVLNDGEARLLTEENLLVRAGQKIQKMGPKVVLIKKGEHGCVILAGGMVWALPAFPTADLVDPTGAGDSFAGGMMGYLAKVGRYDAEAVKAAVARGTVAASFAIEAFSLDGLRRATAEAFEARLEQYRRMLAIE
jgi:sugar/nucleoside kinase (ribokinase family)